MKLKNSFAGLLLLIVVAMPMLPAVALTPDQASEIGKEAYIYGYPLITSEVTRQQMTNVATVNHETLHAPMGQFINVKRYPPADFRGVTAPNADTLYSVAWVDVSKEPWIVSWPDMGKRYYLFPMLSLWTPVIKAPGSRTTGEAAQSYAITGPGWLGTLPPNVQEIKSPTKYAFILARTYSIGTPEDYTAVNKLQDQYKLYPLSSYGKTYTPPSGIVNPNPPFSMTDKVRDVIDQMDTETYFGMMADLMGNVAPPAKEDKEMVDKMAKIGLVLGQPFALNQLEPEVQQSLKDIGKKGFKKISDFKNHAGTIQNGWTIPQAAGRYGTDYLDRAFIAAYGWGANLPEDAVYPSTSVDKNGQKLSGANQYTLHFDKDRTPPVNGFWSITMYDPEYFFYPNKWNKQTVSPRDGLKYNADGSLDLYFQHDYPGKDKEANWLPAPAGDYILMMRLYWPKEGSLSILPPGKGSWTLPGAKKTP